MFSFFTYLDRYWRIRGAAAALSFVLARSAHLSIMYKNLLNKNKPNINKGSITEAVKISFVVLQFGPCVLYLKSYYVDAYLFARSNNIVYFTFDELSLYERILPAVL
jgi:hypothetical protein